MYRSRSTEHPRHPIAGSCWAPTASRAVLLAPGVHYDLPRASINYWLPGAHVQTQLPTCAHTHTHTQSTCIHAASRANWPCARSHLWIPHQLAQHPPLGIEQSSLPPITPNNDLMDNMTYTPVHVADKDNMTQQIMNDPMTEIIESTKFCLVTAGFWQSSGSVG